MGVPAELAVPTLTVQGVLVALPAVAPRIRLVMQGQMELSLLAVQVAAGEVRPTVGQVAPELQHKILLVQQAQHQAAAVQVAPPSCTMAAAVGEAVMPPAPIRLAPTVLGPASP